MKYRENPDYKTRFDAFRAQLNQALGFAPTETSGSSDEDERERIRTERQAYIDRVLSSLDTPIASNFMLYANKMLLIWKREHIEGMDCAKAYVTLKYGSLLNSMVDMIELSKAAAGVYLLSTNKHPDFDTYAEVPLDQKTVVLNRLRDALVPFGEIDFMTTIDYGDLNFGEILERNREEAQKRETAS